MEILNKSELSILDMSDRLVFVTMSATLNTVEACIEKQWFDFSIAYQQKLENDCKLKYDDKGLTQPSNMAMRHYFSIFHDAPSNRFVRYDDAMFEPLRKYRTKELSFFAEPEKVLIKFYSTYYNVIKKYEEAQLKVIKNIENDSGDYFYKAYMTDLCHNAIAAMNALFEELLNDEPAVVVSKIKNIIAKQNQTTRK